MTTSWNLQQQTLILSQSWRPDSHPGWRQGRAHCRREAPGEETSCPSQHLGSWLPLPSVHLGGPFSAGLFPVGAPSQPVASGLLCPSRPQFPLSGPVSGEPGAGALPSTWEPVQSLHGPFLPQWTGCRGRVLSVPRGGRLRWEGTARPLPGLRAGLGPWSLVGPLGDSTSSLLSRASAVGLLAVGPGACAHQPCWVLEAVGQSSVLRGGLGALAPHFSPL